MSAILVMHGQMSDIQRGQIVRFLHGGARLKGEYITQLEPNGSLFSELRRAGLDPGSSPDEVDYRRFVVASAGRVYCPFSVEEIL